MSIESTTANRLSGRTTAATPATLHKKSASTGTIESIPTMNYKTIQIEDIPIDESFVNPYLQDLWHQNPYVKLDERPDPFDSDRDYTSNGAEASTEKDGSMTDFSQISLLETEMNIRCPDMAQTVSITEPTEQLVSEEQQPTRRQISLSPDRSHIPGNTPSHDSEEPQTLEGSSKSKQRVPLLPIAKLGQDASRTRKRMPTTQDTLPSQTALAKSIRRQISTPAIRPDGQLDQQKILSVGLLSFLDGDTSLNVPKGDRTPISSKSMLFQSAVGTTRSNKVEIDSEAVVTDRPTLSDPKLPEVAEEVGDSPDFTQPQLQPQLPEDAAELTPILNQSQTHSYSFLGSSIGTTLSLKTRSLVIEPTPAAATLIPQRKVSMADGIGETPTAVECEADHPKRPQLSINPIRFDVNEEDDQPDSAFAFFSPGKRSKSKVDVTTSAMRRSSKPMIPIAELTGFSEVVPTVDVSTLPTRSYDKFVVLFKIALEEVIVLTIKKLLGSEALTPGTPATPASLLPHVTVADVEAIRLEHIQERDAAAEKQSDTSSGISSVDALKEWESDPEESFQLEKRQKARQAKKVRKQQMISTSKKKQVKSPPPRRARRRKSAAVEPTEGEWSPQATYTHVLQPQTRLSISAKEQFQMFKSHPSIVSRLATSILATTNHIIDDSDPNTPAEVVYHAPKVFPDPVQPPRPMCPQTTVTVTYANLAREMMTATELDTDADINYDLFAFSQIMRDQDPTTFFFGERGAPMTQMPSARPLIAAITDVNNLPVSIDRRNAEALMRVNRLRAQAASEKHLNPDFHMLEIDEQLPAEQNAARMKRFFYRKYREKILKEREAHPHVHPVRQNRTKPTFSGLTEGQLARALTAKH